MACVLASRQGKRGVDGFGRLRGDLERRTGLLHGPLRTALRLPRLPLPLLELGEAVHAQERELAIVLVPVVRVEVDPDDAVEVAQRRWWVERLSYPKAHSALRPYTL